MGVIILGGMQNFQSNFGNPMCGGNSNMSPIFILKGGNNPRALMNELQCIDKMLKHNCCDPDDDKQCFHPPGDYNPADGFRKSPFASPYDQGYDQGYEQGKEEAQYEQGYEEGYEQGREEAQGSDYSDFDGTGDNENPFNFMQNGTSDHMSLIHANDLNINDHKPYSKITEEN